MKLNSYSTALRVAAFLIAVWLIIDGRLLYMLAGLFLAGVIPASEYVIPPLYMLLFWAACGLLLVYILGFKNTKYLTVKLMKTTGKSPVKKSKPAKKQLAKQTRRKKSPKSVSKRLAGELKLPRQAA